MNTKEDQREPLLPPKGKLHQTATRRVNWNSLLTSVDSCPFVVFL